MSHSPMEGRDKGEMGLWAFYAQDGVPQWAVEVVVTAADMHMREVVDVVEKEVNCCIMFVVIQT